MSGLSGLILAWTNELTGYDNESEISRAMFSYAPPANVHCRTVIRRRVLQHLRIRLPGVASNVSLSADLAFDNEAHTLSQCPVPSSRATQVNSLLLSRPES